MTRKPRVVLYNPQNAATPKPVIPMSLLALGAVLDAVPGDLVPTAPAGLASTTSGGLASTTSGGLAPTTSAGLAPTTSVADWVLVDGNLESDPLGAVDRAVRDTEADILGVTVMPGPQLKQAVPHTRALKARHPGLQVVWGGYFPTQHWDVALRSGYVDWVVRGHGELVFAEFLRRWASGDDPADLPGLAYFRHHTQRLPGGAPTGEAVSNPMAPIPHPDKLPDFPYQRIDLLRYVRPTVLGRRTLSHHSSYGCPFFCNFCAVVNMVNGGWRAQSAERTAAVARFYAQHAGIDALEFFDNNFFVHQARTREFAERIRDLGIAWWGEGRIDTLLKYDDRTWQLMADAGLKMIFMGAESGSDETLRRMSKGGKMSTDKTLEIAEHMRRYRIVPEFSFVLGNPPDPEADVAGTIEFIKKLKKVNPQSEIIMYMYTPVPLAGELYEQAKAEGFAFPDTLEGWCHPDWEEFSQRRSTTMPWIKDDLRRRVRNFERVLNAYYPTSTNPNLRGLKTSILRAASGWRWATGRYEYPLELRALHRLFAYQRPETTGF
jgi:anaerobic magnesium-protoporphyrin IX monomethyl ester cyclase